MVTAYVYCLPDEDVNSIFVMCI